MRTVRVFLLAVLLGIPTLAFAGGMWPAQIPTLGEIGLVMLGVSLVGGGALALRRGKR